MSVFKQPVTDMGKKSKKGRLTLELEDGRYKTKEEGTGDINKVRKKSVPPGHEHNHRSSMSVSKIGI